MASFAATSGVCAEPPDPLLDLLIKKGFVTEEEATNVKAEASAIRSNEPPVIAESKWSISKAIKQIEIYGDIRARYEDRTVHDPTSGRIDLQRWRYAVRLGLRGTVGDGFYYGLRMDTAANPRSPWVTMGTSTSASAANGTPYQGPFGKSTAGINIGQAYLGWKYDDLVDLEVGKMPQPLYTTPMIWDNDLNPEGASERFTYSFGNAQAFANFGQFLYQDLNPNNGTAGLGINGGLGQSTDNIFLFAWQAGMKYDVTPDISAKVAATLYNYVGLQRTSASETTPLSPFFGDPYVGEGAHLLLPGSASGYAGYNDTTRINDANQIGFNSLNYPFNQVGLNNLLIVDVPGEVNFKIHKLHARVFGDFAYNLDGAQRARDAQAAYTTILSQDIDATTVKSSPFSPQTHDVKAYQIGFGIGNGDQFYGPMQGVVYGSTAKRHTWEFRTYWQHIEQYALDPNLIDSDFFEGRENLEGVYSAFAYAFTENFIGTIRYGYARRINNQLGTGGSNQDVPQMNPIDHYNLLQADLTFRF